MASLQQPPASPPRAYYAYSLPLISTLGGAYIGLWVLILPIASLTSGAVSAIAGRIGTCLLIGILVTVAWLDWRGLVSMRGLVDWSKIHGWGRFILACVLVLVVEFVLGIYLARAALAAWRTHPTGQTPPTSPTASTVQDRLRTPVGGFAIFGVVFLFALILYSFGGASAAGASQPAIAGQSTPTRGIAAAATRTSQPTATAAKVTPSPTSGPTELAVSITCASGTDYESASVCAHTVPGATASITVTYCSGRDAKSSALGDHRTDAKGNTTWRWTPDTVCRGSTTVVVYASKGGASGIMSTTFDLK